MNLRRLLLPSFSTWLWLLFFLGLSLSSWRLVLINADSDPSFHWRIGNWMIEHGQVIRTDQFSHTRFGAPLISKEWLSEILFAAAGNLLGWNGIVLLSATLIATTMWLLHRRLLAQVVRRRVRLGTARVPTWTEVVETFVRFAGSLDAAVDELARSLSYRFRADRDLRDG